MGRVEDIYEKLKTCFLFRATVDVFSGDGITPLHDAVMYGSKEQVLTLVRAGADTGRKTSVSHSCVAT